MHANDPTAAGNPAAHHGEVGHVVPLRLLVGVLLVLLVLTVITVAVTYVDLGAFNLLTALAIAVIKGSLVLLYFMHLRWDRPFNAIVFVSSIALVALMIALILLDSVQYQPSVIAGYAPALEARLQNRAEVPLTERPGYALMDEIGCFFCHTLDGSEGNGPSFQGVFGRRHTVLREGRPVEIVVDRDYIRRSVLEPEAEVVEGWDPMLFEEELSEAQLETIVEFLVHVK